jgi:negative regulator of sigma E activity
VAETEEQIPEEQAQPAPAPAVKTKAAPVKKKKKGLAKKLGMSGGALLILVAAIAAAVYFYSKYQDSQNKLKHPEVLAQQQTETLVDKVGRLVELPVGEKPTVATVSDVSKLSNQTFFANAKNGDKVLIYSTAKKAILYRPSTDKVINVAPLNINNTQ